MILPLDIIMFLNDLFFIYPDSTLGLYTTCHFHIYGTESILEQQALDSP